MEGFGLTAREKVVALLVLEGRSNDEIGQHLGISANTLKTHLKHVYAKTGTTNRRDLILGDPPPRRPALRRCRKRSTASWIPSTLP